MQPQSPAKVKAKKNQPKINTQAKIQPKPQESPQKPQSPQTELKGKGRKKKNRAKKQRVDPSEFFSFGSNSLAGRAIEGPDYE